MTPRLSIVVVVHDMQREAPRTLYSLSAAYQHGVTAADYEVIVVENGSSKPLEAEIVSSFGGNFRYYFLESAPPSPAFAVNFGVRAARGRDLGLMIDGARIVSPGMLGLALSSLDAFRRPIVASLAFHLGREAQSMAVERGYDSAEEDDLLARSGWRDDGYRLFEISTLAGSSAFGWFQPLSESNCIFMPSGVFEELGGLDERFAQPGGGLVNLDFFYRACDLPDSRLLMLLGEGTFHQVHGGIMTNAPPAEARRKWELYAEEYHRLRGRPYRLPTRRPLLLGDVGASSLRWVRESCDLFWRSPHAPERPQ